MRAAVLGSPIEHSLSPVLHNAGYRAVGLDDWTYSSARVEEADLAAFVSGLDSDWRGLSLTMPLKRACLDVAHDVTALAAGAGVGNTLVRLANGDWLADNTDIGGLVDALGPSWSADWGRVAVLGSGATARSAVLAVSLLGADRITLYARNGDAAAGLAVWAASAAPAVAVTTAALDDWQAGAEPAVLSTLPAGAVDGGGLPPREGLLFDVVYAGWPTPLAQAALDAGMTVVSGFELLVHQAARQFELFTQVAAPVEAMRAAGQARLGQPTEEARGGGGGT